MVSIRPIGKDNLESVLRLDIRPSQKGYVSSTAESLAQAYVYADTAYPFAIYRDETVAGFIMMGYYEEKAYYTLWKLLVDQRFQRMGVGRAALLLGIDYLQDRFQAKEIYTGVVPDNTAARKLYQSVGFVETGVFENNMLEMRLRL